MVLTLFSLYIIVSPDGETSYKMKLDSGRSLENDLRMRLESILRVIPFVEIREWKDNVRMGDRQYDLFLAANFSRKPVNLVVEYKSQAQPRYLRMAALELKSRLQSLKGSYGILMAPYLSAESMEICGEIGVGCVDLSGNAFLSFGNAFIERTGMPNQFPEKRALKSMFSPKSSRVLRAILAEPARRWHVEELARAVGISLGLASKAKQALLSQEWIKEEERRFFPANPETMLEEWTKNYSYKKNRLSSFYSELDETSLETAVKDVCEKRGYPYGLALFSGARRIAPFVRFPRFFSYVTCSVDDVAGPMKLKRVESGANVTLLEPYDDGVFYGVRDVAGIKVVSDIQLYLDLKSYGGRGEEAARAIFEQRIKKAW
jgi:hypothetical protein